jgi:hypothetical protein
MVGLLGITITPKKIHNLNARIVGHSESAGINRHVGVSSERLVYSVRQISPGEKPEPCSLDSKEEGN